MTLMKCFASISFSFILFRKVQVKLNVLTVARGQVCMVHFVLYRWKFLRIENQKNIDYRGWHTGTECEVLKSVTTFNVIVFFCLDDNTRRMSCHVRSWLATNGNCSILFLFFLFYKIRQDIHCNIDNNINESYASHWK